MNAKRKPFVLLLAGLLLSSCITVTTVNIGTKTSLERQLAGDLEPLSDEQLLVSSMRAQAQLAQGSLADLQARALAARRRQLFNRDDINEAKQQGCMGESKDAELVARPCAATREASTAARYNELVVQEKEDRGAVIDWAIAADSALTPADRPEVVRVYRRLLLEAARPGDFTQADQGDWVRH
jgi:uncharacterized protein YdbL (DUF1318 family)